MLTLEEVIADIESAGRRDALRFEPHVFERTGNSNRYEPMVNVAKVRNRCSRDTARVIVSMSAGRFQIMGFNLYDPAGLDFPGTIGTYLNDDMIQAATFRTFCQRKNIYFTVEDLQNEALRLRFAEVYNGPGAPAVYAKKIAARLAIA